MRLVQYNYSSDVTCKVKLILRYNVNVNEHDWAAQWLVISYYALERDKFCPKTVSINNFSSERVDSEGLYGRWILRVKGSCTQFMQMVQNFTPPPPPIPPEQPHERQKAVVAVASKLRRQVYLKLR